MNTIDYIVKLLETLESQKKLRYLSQFSDDNCFGNTIIQYVAEYFLLRVVSDKSEITIQLSPLTKNAWDNLEDILVFLNYAIIPKDDIHLIKILGENFNQVSTLFQKNDSYLSFLDWKERKANELVSKIFNRNQTTES